MQSHDKSPIGILSNETLGICWALSWWIIVCFPGRLPAKIHNLWPVKV